MKFLVDANVLSEVTRPEPSPNVVAWLRANEADLAVDPVILGELEYGILILPAGRRRTRLETWFKMGIQKLHVLEMNAHTAGCWAQLLAQLKKKGIAMPVKDSLIAATAHAHGLTVVTRNTRDFRNSGLPVVDPFL